MQTNTRPNLPGFEGIRFVEVPQYATCDEVTGFDRRVFATNPQLHAFVRRALQCEVLSMSWRDLGPTRDGDSFIYVIKGGPTHRFRVLFSKAILIPTPLSLQII